MQKKALPRRLLKWAGCILLGIIVFVICSFFVLRLVNHMTHRITAENGVDEGIFVELEKQEQFLRIRGEDTRNPVIIWLHGGPASPDSYLSYVFDPYLTDDYTIVCWDQRGCGQTYYHNRNADPENKTVSFAQAVLDLDAVVDYVQTRFSSEDIVLVGHSYGTMLGSKYALEHPDKISAYIGVGQVVSFEDEELYSYQDALEKATALGDDTSKLEAAYRACKSDPTLSNYLALRQHTAPYHTASKEKNAIWLGIRSSFMGWDNIRWFFKQLRNLEGFLALNEPLFDYVMESDVREYGSSYAVPVGFITGGSDWTTPAALSKAYYETIEAPMKRYEIMEGCGHCPQYDEPEKFASILKQMLHTFLPAGSVR